MALSSTNNSLIINCIVNSADFLGYIVEPNGVGGHTVTRPDGSTFDINFLLETITELEVLPDNSIEYTNEDSVTSSWDETLTSFVSNGDGTFTYTDEDGNTTTIGPFSGGGSETITTLVVNPDGTFTYTNEDGDPVTVPVIDSISINDASSCEPIGANSLIRQLSWAPASSTLTVAGAPEHYSESRRFRVAPILATLPTGLHTTAYTDFTITNPSPYRSMKYTIFGPSVGSRTEGAGAARAYPEILVNGSNVADNVRGHVNYAYSIGVWCDNPSMTMHYTGTLAPGASDAIRIRYFLQIFANGVFLGPTFEAGWVTYYARTL